MQGMARVLGPVAHHHVVVGQRLDASPANRMPGQVRAADQRLVTGHGGIDDRRRPIDGSPDLPLVLELVEPARHVARVLQGHQLAQRVLRRDHLDLAHVEVPARLEDVHRDRVAVLRDGKAVGLDHRDIAAARASRGQRIGIHGCLVALDHREVLHAHRDRRVLVRDVRARGVRVLHEGLKVRGQVVHQGVPVALVDRVIHRAKVAHRLQVRPAKHVEHRVIEPECGAVELALQHQGSLEAPVGIDIDALGEVRRQRREVHEAAVHLRPHAGGNARQQIVVGQGRELGAGGIMQHDAHGRIRDVGRDGLLVHDARRPHVPDAGEVERRHRQRRPIGQRGERLRRILRVPHRPDRPVHDLQRLRVL